MANYNLEVCDSRRAEKKNSLSYKGLHTGPGRPAGARRRAPGPAGILRDLDDEVTEKSPEDYTTETVKILREKGIAEPISHAVQAPGVW